MLTPSDFLLSAPTISTLDGKPSFLPSNFPTDRQGDHSLPLEVTRPEPGRSIGVSSSSQGPPHTPQGAECRYLSVVSERNSMSSAIVGEGDPATLEYLIQCLSHWRLASVRTTYSTRGSPNSDDCRRLPCMCDIHSRRLQSVTSKTIELSRCEMLFMLTIHFWDD